MSAEPALRLHDAEPVSNSQPLTDVAPRLMTLADLFKTLQVSKSTGHRLLSAGKIGPKPIRLTTAIVRFDADEVNAWLSTRKQDGNLHDSKTWPAVWSAKRR